MPLLLIKAGPYIAIVLLLGLLALDHYRLIACDSQRQAADAANKSFELDNGLASSAALKEHKALEREIRSERLLQGVIDQQSRTMDKSIRIQLAHPPTGNCDELMGDLAEHLGNKQ